MRGAYVTKRIAPDSCVAITKLLAQQLFEEGEQVTLCGNNVNSYHIFDGWNLGCTVVRENVGDEKSFDDLCKLYLAHLDRELGRYLVFYVKKKVVQKRRR